MNWISQWEALSARTAGLLSAAHYLVRCLTVNSDATASVKRLADELSRIRTELARLAELHGAIMPPQAVTALREYIAIELVERQASNPTWALQQIAELEMFRARFAYLVRDTEVESRNATELAFEHLQRLIVVDEDVRSKWQGDFKLGETYCEKRGAVHLLSHGIWAFKAHGAGAATDLVYSEPLSVENPVLRRTARAIVLTEWKVVGKDNIEQKAEEARRQTSLYAAGVFGDLELKGTRYIVLVGDRQFEPPADVVEYGVTFRHFALATAPERASVSARRSAGKPPQKGN